VRKLIPFSLLLVVSFLGAQSSPVPTAPGSDPESVVRLQMELLRQSVRDDNEVRTRQAETARQVQIARLQFMAKANHFVALWGDLVQRLNDRQTFDAKLAKKVSKAFCELEKSDGWPLREGAK
jgi:hypothetical protein